MGYPEIISIGLIGFLGIVCVVMTVFLLDLTRARLVPFVRSRETIQDLLLNKLNLKKNDVFIDLGCGDGEIISKVSDKFDGIKARGYEIALLPYLRGKYRERQDKNIYRIHKKDFMKEDLSDANVLYSYLMPYYMKPLWDKIKKECKKGTLLYSFAFEIPSVKPIELHRIKNEKKKHKKYDELFIYKV